MLTASKIKVDGLISTGQFGRLNPHLTTTLSEPCYQILANEQFRLVITFEKADSARKPAGYKLKEDSHVC